MKFFSKTGVEAISWPRSFFLYIIVYYWILSFLVDQRTSVVVGGVLYYMHILPISLYVLASFVNSMNGLFSYRINSVILLFLFLVIMLSIVRVDVSTIFSVGLLSLTIYVIFHYRPVISVSVLNLLFMLSIPIEQGLFLSGLSIYPVVPFLGTTDSLSWRISLLPTVANSAFFSAIILFANLYNRDVRFRYIVICISTYMVIFSGLRTVLIATLIAAFYYILQQKKLFKTSRASLWYLVLSTVAFVVFLLFGDNIVTLLGNTGNVFVNDYLFRKETGLENSDDFVESAYRAWLWSEHIRMAYKNPIFGIGTFDFASNSIYSGNITGEGTGSESFITGLYTRIGVLAVMFLFVIISMVYAGIKSGNNMSAIMGIYMLFGMLTYGSILSAYSFVFLIMIALLNPHKNNRMLTNK